MNVNDFFKVNKEYIRAQLFFGALELDLFSYLDDGARANEVALKTGYDTQNLYWYLTALASEGFIEKKEDVFKNIHGGSEYLSKHHPLYIGDIFLSNREMMTLKDAVEYVKEGANPNIVSENTGYKVYDFESIAQSNGNSIKLFRAKPFVERVSKLFAKDEEFTFIDLGAGSGILGIEIAKAFPKSKGILYDVPNVTKVAKGFIDQEHLNDRIEIMSGDFLVDDIGKGYDLIIASGIFHFAKKDLDHFFEKLNQSLAEDGYICSVTYTVSEDYLKPAGSFTGWLSSHLKGLDALLTGRELKEAINKFFVEVKEYSDEKCTIHRKINL